MVILSTNKQKMRKLIFLLALIPWIAVNVYADEKPSFTASAPDVVAVGDQFRLSYVINTQDVKDFTGPSSIDGVDILMGPNSSFQQSFVSVNGKSTASTTITYTYILKALKEGTFSIPAATITVDNEKLISNAVKIKVIPADRGADPNPSSNNTNSRNNSAESQSTSGQSSSSASSFSNEDFFVTSSVTKTNVYEQEAFLLTYKIYTLVDLSFDNIKLPDFKGFHSQEVELPRNQSWGREHYNGRNYNTAVYRQFVLFPQHGGDLTIEPARFDASLTKVVRSRNPIDDFFNGGSNYIEVKKTATTSSINVKVNALPAGKPAGFSGGVGDFSITSSINSQDVKTNDAITIKLVISGAGNMKLLSTPEIKFPADFETFEPKVVNNFRLTREGLTGTKVIEYLAIPRHSGKFTIPGVNFSYFDLKSKSYKTVDTPAYEINVEKGEGSSEQVIANFTNKEDIKILGEDIRFIKLGDVKLRSKGELFYGSFSYWLFYIIPALAFIVFFIVYRKQAMENANMAKVKTKRANKVATRRMKQAGKLLAENRKDEFYDEVLKALWGYISDKLNIPVSRLSKDNIEGKLTDYGVNRELIDEFISALNECEFARFAPGDENQAMDKVYSSAFAVINKIEASIKK